MTIGQYPTVGEAGLYTICCGWRLLTDLVPLKGKRTVRVPTELGQEVGRCRWHPNRDGGVAAYVVRTGL